MEGAGLKKEEPVEVEIEDLYPLSPTQQGMLFHCLESSDSDMYFNQVCCEFDATLNIQALEQAWQKLLNRHSILRTAFVWEDLDEPLQVVCRNIKLPLRQEDWRTMTGPEQQPRFESFLLADRLRGFNLSEAPLMRIAVIRVADDRFNFIWSHHHLLLDGWSVPTLLKELFDVYAALHQGRELELPPAPSYAEYIDWLNRRDLSQAEDFWRQTLKGFAAPTPLRIDKARPDISIRETDYDHLTTQLSKAETARLLTMSRQHRLTLNTLVQGAWALLLSRYSGDDDIVFGTTFSGRPLDLPGAETMIGLFINLLPVRAQVNPEELLIPWLSRLQDRLVGMQQWQFSPLVRIQEWSEVARRTALFETVLGFENSPVVNPGRGRYDDNPMAGIRTMERTNYPLTLKAFPGSELGFEVLYDCVRFAKNTIVRLLDHLRTLLDSMATDPDQRLGDISLLTGAERHQLLSQWNDTGADYPQRALVHELFEAQARNSPDAVALEFQDRQLTFAELNARANQLARYLIENGVGPDVKVGICMERSLEMVVGIVATIKAGGAYMPLDPAFPGDRLAFILRDTSAPVVLTQSHLLGALRDHSAHCLCLDSDWERVEKYSGADSRVAVEDANLAYVIYTSGSTGLPKGVMSTHAGLRNRLLWMQETYNLTPSDRVLQKTPYSFDVSVWEFLWPLMTGARLVVAEPDGHQDAAYLINLISKREITTLHFVPSMLRAILEQEGLESLTSLRQVICSGEALSFELQEKFFGRLDIDLHNLYGPTEASIDVTYHNCRDGAKEGVVPIGRPIANTRIHILSKQLQPAPVIVPGELHIGGIGLARGYINRPDLTAEKFIPDALGKEPGARLYKTGDLTRWLEDGNIEYLGRMDFQVKIRGFRIELGEIEAVLGQHPGIKEAIVVAREDRLGDKRLIAYVVADRQAELSANELRGFVQEKLPGYMVPSAVVTLDALPVTTSGKLDRKALPLPEQPRTEKSTGYVAPRTLYEEALAKMWGELLGVAGIGIHDNFFDLGGHSITAVRLLAQIQKRFGQELPLNSLMRASTIEAMAGLISQQTGSLDWSPIVEIQTQGSGYPFFCVHPAGGNVLRYRHLARYLGSDQPFYGLEAPGLADDRNHYVLIENLASYYIEHIKKIQPEGPYFLGGHSFGGFVAFEMSQQLQRRGEPIGLLALIDTPSPSFVNKPIDDATLFAGRIREIGRELGIVLTLAREELEHLDRQEQLNYLIEYMKRNGLLSEDMDEQWIGRYLEGLRARERAILVYKPTYCEGRITLFRASEIEPDAVKMHEDQGLDLNDPSLGWGQMASEPVAVHYVPGFHDTIMFEPNVEILAAKLKACINRVEAKSI